ncbi:hypothetical protein ENBRE01_0722 [Enteropsectra breve]|nr:hypothetical protein ENBRE01_0722 [Enteropsectra breve]
MLGFARFLILVLSYGATTDDISLIRRSTIAVSASCYSDMLMETCVLNKKIREGIKCMCCMKQIKATAPFSKEPQFENTYYNYSINYFSCPKCDSIAHIECFLKSSENKNLKCSNPNCELILKSNEKNKLFAQLIYVLATRKINFGVFRKLYSYYSPDDRKVSHSVIIKILTESKTLAYMDQASLWRILKKYFDMNYMDKRYLFKVYNHILETQDASFVRNFLNRPLQERKALFEVGTLLLFIDEMQKKNDKTLTAKDLLEVYECWLEKNAAEPAIQNSLGAHFVYFILTLENPVKHLEEMFVEMCQTKDLVVEKQLSSEFLHNLSESPFLPESLEKIAKKVLPIKLLRSVLCELGKNNLVMIKEIAETYLRSDNQGVFVPILINFFENNGMRDQAEDIIKEQLKEEASNKPFQEMSVNNTMYVLRAARRFNKALSNEYIEQILKWIHSSPRALSNENIRYISDYLQDFTANLTLEQHRELQSLFVKYYSRDTAAIYVRCMCYRLCNEENLASFTKSLDSFYKEGSALKLLKKLRKEYELENLRNSNYSGQNIDYWSME